MDCCSCEYRRICPCRNQLANKKLTVLFLSTVRCPNIKEYIAEFWKAKTVRSLVPERRRVNPPSWGQEVEVARDNIDEDFIEVTAELLGGGWDGSGPWEFKIGPFRYDYFPREFIDYVTLNHLVRWAPQTEQGNHLHIRPAPLSNVKMWIDTGYNLVALSVLLKELLSFTGGGFRSRWRVWAGPPDDFLWTIERIEEDAAYFNQIARMRGRWYEAVTWNRNRKTTLTLEVRLCEAHPAKAFAFQNLVMAWTRWYGRLFEVEDRREFCNQFEAEIEDFRGRSFRDLWLRPLHPVLEDEHWLLRMLDTPGIHPFAKRVVRAVYVDGVRMFSNESYRGVFLEVAMFDVVRINSHPKLSREEVAERIYRILVEHGDGFLDLSGIDGPESIIKNRERYYMLIDDDGNILSVASLDLRDQRIKHLCTPREHRGKGYATILVAWLLIEAYMNNLSYVECVVRHGSLSWHIMERLGFFVSRREDHYDVWRFRFDIYSIDRLVERLLDE